MVLVTLELNFELDLPNGGWGPGDQNGGEGGGPQGGDGGDPQNPNGGGGGDPQNPNGDNFQEIIQEFAGRILELRLRKVGGNTLMHKTALECRKKKNPEKALQICKSTFMKKEKSRKKRSQILSPQMTKFLFRELSADVELETGKGGDKKKMRMKALPLRMCEIALKRNLKDALLMCTKRVKRSAEKGRKMCNRTLNKSPEKARPVDMQLQEHIEEEF